MTDCRLRTNMPFEPMHVVLSPSRGETILQSALLREALSELDWCAGSSTLSFLPATQQQSRDGTEDPVAGECRVVLTGEGPYGVVEVTIPESADGLNSISVDKETHVHYKLSHLLLNKKALSFSEDTQLKVDDQGTMSLMHMIPGSEKDQFVCLTLTIQAQDDPDL